MNTETLDRLEVDLAEANRVGFITAIVNADDLKALISIARRVADVEGMAERLLPELMKQEMVDASQSTLRALMAKRCATAISRHILGDAA